MPSGDNQTFYWLGKTGGQHPKWKGGEIAYRYRRYRLINQLKNKPCADCFGWFDPCQMDFDHLGDKKFQISRTKHVPLERLLKEISKCDLICSNCHRLRTQQRLNQKRSKLGKEII